MAFVDRDRPVQPGALPVGELLGTATQDRADPVERVVFAATVAVDLCWTRRRTSSTAWVPSLTTWNASSTAVASSSWSSMAFL